MDLESIFFHVAEVPFPNFSGLRILHMPIILGEEDSIPKDLHGYLPLLEIAASKFPQHAGDVVYFTIDEKKLKTGQTHRRPGLHVDGWHKVKVGEHYIGGGGGSWGGGGGSWGGASYSVGSYKKTLDNEGTGLLTAANKIGCRAWMKTYSGEPEAEGDCEHMRSLFPKSKGVLLQPNQLYWLNPLCVHESIPVTEDMDRQFVRISLPSNSDWYEGCTPNPLGVLPTGSVKPRRTRFMGFMDHDPA